jgi:hypothetical protein
VSFEAMKKPDIAQPILVNQMKQKPDSKMKSGEMVYLVHLVYFVFLV